MGIPKSLLLSNGTYVRQTRGAREISYYTSTAFVLKKVGERLSTTRRAPALV